MTSIGNTIFNSLRNWKTLIPAILGFILMTLNQLRVITITPDQQTGLIAAAVVWIGFFAKDSDKAGVK